MVIAAGNDNGSNIHSKKIPEKQELLILHWEVIQLQIFMGFLPYLMLLIIFSALVTAPGGENCNSFQVKLLESLLCWII